MASTPDLTDARLRLAAARLPALPEVLLKLLELFRREDANLDEFASLLAQDAGISGRLLAVASSAAYRGRSSGAPTLERAMASLGTEAVKMLVINQSIFQTFSSLPALRQLDLRPYWRHALCAALVAREAARRIDYPRPDEAYLGGLLHDIGRLGLLAAVPERYAQAFQAEDSAALCGLEQRALQVNHAEAGAWLAEAWGLDPYLADSLRYHHEPPARLADRHPLIRLVALAHLLAEHPPDALEAIDAGQLCGLRPEALDALAAAAQSGMAVAADQLGLDLSSAAPAAAAERLVAELSPVMLTAAVLGELPLHEQEAVLLQRLADAARILFQFTEVIVMLGGSDPAPGTALRWLGAAQPALSATLPPAWLEFTLPCAPGSPLGDGLRARRPVFVSRQAPPLSVADDQLLRLLATDQLVCLPLRADGALPPALLVCVGDAGLLAGVARRPDFLFAFAAQADAARRRSAQLRAAGEQRLAEQAAGQRSAALRLAHEVNNPLSIMQNYLALIEAKAGQLPGLSAHIGILQEEIARVGRLVQALSDPRPAGEADGVDPNLLIDEVARLFSHAQAPGSGVEVLAVGREATGLVQANADALRQVLVNLVKNAVEALPGPGRVVLSNNGMVNLGGRIYLELSVRDDGPGLPPEVWSRLAAGGAVAPAAGSGRRGQGLAIVHDLVAAQGGLVQCRSGPMGTSFDLLLPPRAASSAPGPGPA